jgi:putative transposase
VDSISLQKSVENLNDSYTRYYKKQNHATKFKSKKNKVQSYTTKHTNGNIAVLDKNIKLPKLGLVRFASPKVGKSRAVFSGATIRRNPTGKYFISIVVEKEGQEWPKTHSSVGVDVVLKDFAVLSDGKPPYPNPKFYRT